MKYRIRGVDAYRLRKNREVRGGWGVDGIFQKNKEKFLYENERTDRCLLITGVSVLLC